MTNKLSELALKHGTDKWGHHWYTDKYEKILAHLKNKAIKLLEIGVGGYEYPDRGGQSLKMWKEFFPKAQIFGLDYFDKSKLQEDRIKIFKGSQSDEAILNQIKNYCKELHVIIDDGSHKCFDQITSFKNLFPWMDANGIYIIEDTETSYWRDYGGNDKWLADPLTCVNYFKALTDALNHKTIAGDVMAPPHFIDMIESITFYRNIIVIQKGVNR
jgi:hypothetical protein